MALVECKECGHEISKKAKACPNCGALRKKSIFRRLIKYSLIGFFSLVVLGGVFEAIKISNMTAEEKAAYDAAQEQRKADQEADRIAKAAEKAKAEGDARVAAEIRAMEEAKSEEEAQVIEEVKAAELARVKEEARVAAEAESAERARADRAKADEEARLKAEAEVSVTRENEEVVSAFKERNEAPWLKTTGTVTGDYTVDVIVESNIPFEFESGVSIDLSGLADDESYIGTGLIRVPVTNGSAKLPIDVREHWTHPHPFPSGTYILEGYFYNQWKENKEIAELLAINEKLGTASAIRLEGSGESPEILRTHLSRRGWAMLNVNVGEPLTDVIFSKLPDLEVIGKEKRNASVDFLNWYTASADMTIIVNSLTKEIVTWESGRKDGD